MFIVHTLQTVASLLYFSISWLVDNSGLRLTPTERVKLEGRVVKMHVNKRGLDGDSE